MKKFIRWFNAVRGFRFFVRRRCGDQMSPPGFRVAYFDLCRNEIICCPVGLHLVVMLFRRLWELSFWCKPSRMERLMERVRQVAIREYIAGRHGRIDWKDALDAIQDNRSNLP